MTTIVICKFYYHIVTICHHQTIRNCDSLILVLAYPLCLQFTYFQVWDTSIISPVCLLLTSRTYLAHLLLSQRLDLNPESANNQRNTVTSECWLTSLGGSGICMILSFEVLVILATLSCLQTEFFSLFFSGCHLRKVYYSHFIIALSGTLLSLKWTKQYKYFKALSQVNSIWWPFKNTKVDTLPVSILVQ